MVRDRQKQIKIKRLQQAWRGEKGPLPNIWAF
jgi:hypothetical protein